MLSLKLVHLQFLNIFNFMDNLPFQPPSIPARESNQDNAQRAKKLFGSLTGVSSRTFQWIPSTVRLVELYSSFSESFNIFNTNLKPNITENLLKLVLIEFDLNTILEGQMHIFLKKFSSLNVIVFYKCRFPLDSSETLTMIEYMLKLIPTLSQIKISRPEQWNSLVELKFSKIQKQQKIPLVLAVEDLTEDELRKLPS